MRIASRAWLCSNAFRLNREVSGGLFEELRELCMAAGVDQTLVEAWIEVGRGRASAAALTTHKACVLWDS